MSTPQQPTSLPSGMGYYSKPFDSFTDCLYLSRYPRHLGSLFLRFLEREYGPGFGLPKSKHALQRRKTTCNLHHSFGASQEQAQPQFNLAIPRYQRQKICWDLQGPSSDGLTAQCFTNNRSPPSSPDREAPQLSAQSSALSHISITYLPTCLPCLCSRIYIRRTHETQLGHAFARRITSKERREACL